MSKEAGQRPQRPLRVVLAGGGTAGHVEPAMSLADALCRRLPDTQVTAFGTADGLESRLVPERGYPLRVIPRVPLPRRLTADLLTLPLRLARAVKAARAILVELRPDVVVGFGGYVALPVYLAARRVGCPFVVHEANARPGMANRVGALLSPYVAVSTTNASLRNARMTGIPLRVSVALLDRTKERAAARQEWGLRPELPTLLVFGGSQGAGRINEAMAEAAHRLLDEHIQVLHAAGPGNEVTVKTRTGDPPYVVVSYLDHMERAYAAADLALCRSGAMTCAELSAVGLPALLVPYPHSNGEQEVNAQPMVRAGGGVLVSDRDLTADRLVAEVVPLLRDPDKLSVMGRAAASLGHRDADELLVNLTLEAAGWPQ